ncbi:hypothetical protein TNIN_414041 [Trichonephila inaurata madagascariensis]|uniref:Uncharacterized protein n=1 Tax=Trichonephila inaurata madagascariensis TaxID=2747483 RepID=A0A8X7BXQ9_9ARAC|nr:hypothetical protein TNIN_414041 [Trichonephila inaurata madagascariensis]
MLLSTPHGWEKARSTYLRRLSAGKSDFSKAPVFTNSFRTFHPSAFDRFPLNVRGSPKVLAFRLRACAVSPPCIQAVTRTTESTLLEID